MGVRIFIKIDLKKSKCRSLVDFNDLIFILHTYFLYITGMICITECFVQIYKYISYSMYINWFVYEPIMIIFNIGR